MNYSNYKFSFDKYKNKTFIDVAKEIITKDEKYICFFYFTNAVAPSGTVSQSKQSFGICGHAI